jgi:abortive infection bacteriophage resistance protein
MRTQAGFFMPETFSKPAISLDEQVALLKSRGLLIEDEAQAKHYLRNIGYYRLSGYGLVLRPSWICMCLTASYAYTCWMLWSVLK